MLMRKPNCQTKGKQTASQGCCFPIVQCALRPWGRAWLHRCYAVLELLRTQACWIEKMFADMSANMAAAAAWCQGNGNRCQVSWSSRKLWLLRLVWQRRRSGGRAHRNLGHAVLISGSAVAQTCLHSFVCCFNLQPWV